MELSARLKTIEPLKGAFDILRYYGETQQETADAEDIADSLDLGEVAFGRAIRRLVTKGYLTMDGSGIYRLTDAGQNAVDELAAYDEALNSGQISRNRGPARRQVSRRLVVGVPATLPASQPAAVHIGFHEAAPGHQIDEPLELVVRASIVNGGPEKPEDLIFEMDDAHTVQAVQFTAAATDMSRLRFEVYQLGEMGDVSPAGGMYVDVPVDGSGAQQMVAYATDITLTL